ncbi:unnamed protein product [Triticum turgidum subsp. durum]|uniref:Uncharacterized protein n=1 Tax=Triticum turgidum subsp. durum TaxID=4567 RepID=A0A9R1RWX8_TRITD|nr:unnamed protein product [Triticum turgidum subsp. durum]
MSCRNDMLKFDLEEQTLAVINGPPVTDRPLCCQIIQAEAKDGAVGFSVLSYPRLQMWQGIMNIPGVATWVMWKTIEMNNILGLPPQIQAGWRGFETILGYSEDTYAIFIYVDTSVYMVQLKSMQSKRLHKTIYINDYHPLTGFYSPGKLVAAPTFGAPTRHPRKKT